MSWIFPLISESRAVFWRLRKFKLVDKSFLPGQNYTIWMNQSSLDRVSFFKVQRLVNSIAYFMGSLIFDQVNQTYGLLRDCNNFGIKLEHKVAIDMIEVILMAQNVQSLLIRTSKNFPFELQELNTPFLLWHLESIQINFETWISSHINLIPRFTNPSQRYSSVDFFLKRKGVFVQKTYFSVWSHRYKVLFSLQDIINAIKMDFFRPIPF